MTGVTSSKRQWASWRVRALTAAILALALLITALWALSRLQEPRTLAQPVEAAPISNVTLEQAEE